MNNDVLSLKVRELAYELKIEHAMTVNLTTISPNDTMSTVRKLLKEKRISGLPVIEDDKLIGMISIENFIKGILHGGKDEKVIKNMTSKVECIYAHEPLVYAIRKFEKLRYGRFPVLEYDTGNLVGIITKGDIIKCLFKRLEMDYHEEELSKYRASYIFKDVKSDGTTIVFQYKIKGGDYKVAGEQSGFLKVNLLRLGIHPKITRQVTIAACEAEMNIIIFTDGGELIASVDEDKIKVNAIDEGPGIPDIEKAMHPGFSTASDWVRELGFGAGMGLPNIKNCTDEMRIKSTVGEGTNLEFVVNIAK